MGLEVKSLGKVGWEGANARARHCVVEHSMRTRSPLKVSSVTAGASAFLFTVAFLGPSSIVKWTDRWLHGWMDE